MNTPTGGRPFRQCPNISVLQSAKDYLEAAQILVDFKRLQPCTVLAALSIELFLTSFLAERLAPWTARVEHGHALRLLYNCISPDDRREILRTSAEHDPRVHFEISLDKHSDAFTGLRYPYEQSARYRATGSDIVYFADHCLGVGWGIAQKRSV
jgi:hypothetical protein